MKGIWGTPPTLEVNGYRRLRLCNEFQPSNKHDLDKFLLNRLSRKDLQPFAATSTHICSSLEARGFRFKLSVDPPILNTFAFISKATAIFLVFLSISKEPISCSVGQGFEPQWAKNLLKPTLPKCFNIDVVTRSPIKKQRKIQKNLQINDGNASNLQIFKSQKFGTSPNHPLVFWAFGPITWIFFPTLSAPNWTRSCLILPCLDGFYWRVHA